MDYRRVEPAPLRHPAEGRLRIWQLLTAVPGVPAAGDRRRIFAGHQGPAAGRAAGPGDRALSPAGRSTSTPWSCPLSCSSAPCSSASSSCCTVPRLLNLPHQAGQGLSACTASTTRSTGRSRADQFEVLHATSSVTAPTSSTICAGSGTTSRRSSRPGRTSAASEAREPVPELRRQRNDGRRRAVDHQRGLLEHVLPACPGHPSGHTTSSATTSPTRREAGRATTACSRRRSWSRSTGGSARVSGCSAHPAFEIPRSVERDSSFDHLRTGDELRRRLAAKNRHNFVTMGCPVRAVALLLRAHRARPMAAQTSTPQLGAAAIASERRARPRSSASPTGSWSNGSSTGSSALRRAVLLDLRARTSGGTNGLEGAVDRVPRSSSPAPRS